MEKNVKRISGLREWMILTRQMVLILLSDRKNLLVSLTFPVIAAFITVWMWMQT